MRNFYIGNLCLRVDMPEEIPVGTFLARFAKQAAALQSAASQPAAILIRVTMAPAPFFGKYTELGAHYLEADTGRVIAHYAQEDKALRHYPPDWQNNLVTLEATPRLFEQPGLRMEQILMMGGMHSAFLHRRGLILHAGYILRNDRAILFMGPSGIGKSTQAALWEHAGAKIINGDRVLVYVGSEGIYAAGYPACGSSRICENVTAPVQAVVLLGKGSQNQLVLPTKPQCYTALLSAAEYWHWSREENNVAGDIVSELVNRLPIVRYDCLPDISAVEELRKWLETI